MSFTQNYTVAQQTPPNVELSTPFSIDPSGAVSVSTDPQQWAKDHLLAILMTSPGERVMRPTFGAGLIQFLFMNNDPTHGQLMVALIQAQVQQYEPTITVHDVTAVQSGEFGQFALEIDYSINTSSQTYTATVSQDGAGTVVITQ